MWALRRTASPTHLLPLPGHRNAACWGHGCSRLRQSHQPGAVWAVGSECPDLPPDCTGTQRVMGLRNGRGMQGGGGRALAASCILKRNILYCLMHSCLLPILPYCLTHLCLLPTLPFCPTHSRTLSSPCPILRDALCLLTDCLAQILPAWLQGSYAITGATLTNATAEAEFMARFSSQQYVAGAVFSALGLVRGKARGGEGCTEWPGEGRGEGGNHPLLLASPRLLWYGMVYYISPPVQTCEDSLYLQSNCDPPPPPSPAFRRHAATASTPSQAATSTWVTHTSPTTA